MEDKEKLPETLDEFCDYIGDYIVKYADDIYVREQIDGKWGSYSLAEMPTKLTLKWAMTFIKERRIPHRVIKEE